ncbi:unnamed protein product [Medioppia subpectinata]|uniref:Uncharacterized protein n=1 Tax=Medioppia subpectinata TaxID=1979941 RepID=A0A7R9QJ70_9ACAR|nr:unnamed protein product [Medioppia subpectinata]CAG2120910.1 unnamed protein product [Medioppia subpectinata]
MLANNEDILLRSEQKKNTKSLDAFESVKRKHDDYGHLRFGRNDPSVPQLDARVKYNDPDYGHMRFG